MFLAYLHCKGRYCDFNEIHVAAQLRAYIDLLLTQIVTTYSSWFDKEMKYEMHTKFHERRYLTLSSMQDNSNFQKKRHVARTTDKKEGKVTDVLRSGTLFFLNRGTN